MLRLAGYLPALDCDKLRNDFNKHFKCFNNAFTSMGKDVNKKIGGMFRPPVSLKSIK